MTADPLAALDPGDRARLEAVLVEFDLAWVPDGLAAAADRLPADGPFRRAALRELVLIDLERQWRRDRPVPVEDYLERFPELKTGNVPAELVAAELAARGRFGSTADEADYARRFPDLAADLPRLMTGTTDPERTADTPPAAAGPSSPRLPERFGRYRILRPLGRGGMGSVYLARDTELDRLVALKVPHLRPDDAEAQERFQREARAAATIEHPNVCRVYDVGKIDGTPFLTMAYIDGPTVADVLRDEPVPPRRAAELTRDVARALAEAHRRGVVHRDLKPGNILIGPDGEPVVTDFGLARRAADDLRLTTPGAFVGTPLYSSPEQAAGDTERIGPASDIFSLGVVLYEMLAGRPPFTGSRTDVLAGIMSKDPPPPSAVRSGLDPRLDAITRRALAKEPADRFADMDAFADALEVSLRAPSTTGPGRLPRRAMLVIGLIAMIGLIVLLIRWPRGDAGPGPKPGPGPDGDGPAQPKLLYVGTIPESAHHFVAVGLSPDGKHVSTATAKDYVTVTVRRWDASTGQEESATEKTELYEWARFTPDGGRYLIGGGLPDTELRWVASSQTIQKFRSGTHAKDGAVSRGGGRVIVSWDSTEGPGVGVWDVQPVKLVGKYTGHGPAKAARVVALSDDGTWACSAGPDRFALWKVEPDAPKRAVEESRNDVTCADFVPKTHRLVVGTTGGDVAEFEPAAKGLVRRFGAGHPDAVTCLSVAPTGRLAASGGLDRRVRVWDADTGQERWALDGPASSIVAVAFSADGKRLAAAAADRTWRVWELPE
ncbi:MAG TPA: serine/threonine-protein kinase [Gemmataceae bacterium]|nr:serine/threonine-protein kinase [Gemmataceae bacterium]